MSTPGQTIHSWQKVAKRRPGKEPRVELDVETSAMFQQAAEVLKVIGRLAQGGGIVIDYPNIPND